MSVWYASRISAQIRDGSPEVFQERAPGSEISELRVAAAPGQDSSGLRQGKQGLKLRELLEIRHAAVAQQTLLQIPAPAKINGGKVVLIETADRTELGQPLA